MTTLFEVLHRKAEPYKVTLIKGQKGGYGWEITCVAEHETTVLNMIEHTDMELRKVFGRGEPT